MLDEAPPDAGAALEEIGPTPGAITMSLEQAVATALSGNFGLISSAESVQTARLNYRGVAARFYPQVTPRYVHGEDERVFGLDASQLLPWTGGSVTATSAWRSQPDDASPAPRSSDLALTLTQPLLRGAGPNATFFDLRNSRRARVASERSLNLARQQVAVDVTRAYYQVLQQRMLLAVAQQSLDRSESLLRASEARLQVGLVSKLDVFRAQLQAAQTQDAMVRSEAALQDALERFRALLGRSPAEPIEPEDTHVPEEVPAPSEPLEILVQRAMQQRLDLLEARDRVDDAQRNAALAKQNLLPQLDLNVGVARIGQGPSFGSAWRAGDTRVNVFVTTSYPLEHSSLSVNKAVADIAVTASAREVVQLEWAIESEVRAAVRDLEQIRKSVDLQKTAVEVAQQQHRLATLRYQRGLASNFDVVQAEESLVLARSALVTLLTSFQVGRIDLERVTGSLDVDARFAPAAGAGRAVP
ncbi:MAG TPA: TolC family protein [Vicinamibacteria bacterium]|nr:TolC family protein [Vicinamibacteria bacterium]